MREIGMECSSSLITWLHTCTGLPNQTRQEWVEESDTKASQIFFSELSDNITVHYSGIAFAYMACKVDGMKFHESIH